MCVCMCVCMCVQLDPCARLIKCTTLKPGAQAVAACFSLTSFLWLASCMLVSFNCNNVLHASSPDTYSRDLYKL